jgi:hypothetical protein
MSGLSGFVAPATALGLNALLVKPKRGIYDPTTGKLFPTIPIPQATIQELMHDDLEITDHPVEQGSSISDHAYKRPSELIVKAAWSNSPSKTGLAALAATALAAGAAANSTVGSAVNLYSQVQGAVGLVNTLTSSISGQSQDQMNAILKALLSLQQAGSTGTIPLVNVYTGRRNYYNVVLKSISVENDWKTENALFATLTFKQIILVSVQVANGVGPTAPTNPAANGAPTQTGLQKLSSSVQNFMNVPPITSVTKLFS